MPVLEIDVILQSKSVFVHPDAILEAKIRLGL